MLVLYILKEHKVFLSVYTGNKFILNNKVKIVEYNKKYDELYQNEADKLEELLLKFAKL